MSTRVVIELGRYQGAVQDWAGLSDSRQSRSNRARPQGTISFLPYPVWKDGSLHKSLGLNKSCRLVLYEELKTHNQPDRVPASRGRTLRELHWGYEPLPKWENLERTYPLVI